MFWKFRIEVVAGAATVAAATAGAVSTLGMLLDKKTMLFHLSF